MSEKLFSLLVLALFAAGTGALSGYYSAIYRSLPQTPIAVINYGELVNRIDKDLPKEERRQQADELARITTNKLKNLQEQGYLILNSSQVQYAPDHLKITVD